MQTNRTGEVPTTEFKDAMGSLIVAAFPVGGCFGAVIGGAMIKKMGR